MRNVKNGKTVILAVEFRLSKTKQVDADGLLIKGTARWLEPVVGDWERAWGYRLVEPLGSEKRKN